MTEEKTTRGGTLLPLLIAVLIAAVVVQSIFLLRLYHSSTGKHSTDKEQRSVISRQNDTNDDKWSDWNVQDWDPYAEMQQMQERMRRMFDDSFNRFRTSPGFIDKWNDLSFAPNYDLIDDGNNYVLKFNIPGADKAKIDVNIEDRVLTVKGSTDERIETKGDKIFRLERRIGQFQRSVTLPGAVNAEKMKAEYKNGILTVEVPKSSKSIAKKSIEVI